MLFSLAFLTFLLARGRLGLYLIDFVLVPDLFLNEFLFGLYDIVRIQILLDFKNGVISCDAFICASDLFMELIVEHKVSIGPKCLPFVVNDSKSEKFFTNSIDWSFSFLTQISQYPDVFLTEINQFPVIFSQQLFLGVVADIESVKRRFR